MRKGKILSMDSVLGYGLIEDENEQEIEFSLGGLSIKPNVCDEVLFEIVMGVCGLKAIDIILL